MRRTVLLAMFAISVMTSAQVVETFSYTTGDIGGEGTTAASGTGQAGNWGTYPAGWLGGLPAGDPTLSVTSGSLSAPTGYNFTPSDNKLSSSANVFGMFGVDASGQIDFDSDNTYYISYLFSASADPVEEATANVGVVEFRDSANSTLFSVGDTTFSRQLRISSGGGNDFGSDWAGSGDYLILVKVDAASVGNDTISASYFKSTGSISGEPVTWDVTRSSALTGTVTGIGFNSNGTGGSTITYEFDEFRLGNSYGAVIPEPSTLLLVGGALAALTVFRRRG